MTDLLTIFFAKYFGYILLGILLIWLLSPYVRSPEGGKNRGKHVFLALQMIAAAILARGIITETIRFFWERTRPFVEQNFVPLIPHAASASFPSGHAAFFFALGTVIYLYNKKAGLLFLLGAALMGAARVAAGLHWPSDILGGGLIGIFSASFVVLILSKFLFKL